MLALTPPNNLFKDWYSVTIDDFHRLKFSLAMARNRQFIPDRSEFIDRLSVPFPDIFFILREEDNLSFKHGNSPNYPIGFSISFMLSHDNLPL
jgi:hypothetical protein